MKGLSKTPNGVHLLACTHFFFSAFLRGLLPCVRTNNSAYVRHTSEGARTVRDLRPIYSNLWDPFATVRLRLLSLIFLICFRTSSIIFFVSKFFFPFQARKFRFFVGSRTRVLSFRSPIFFHCASWPRHVLNFWLSFQRTSSVSKIFVWKQVVVLTPA